MAWLRGRLRAVGAVSGGAPAPPDNPEAPTDLIVTADTDSLTLFWDHPSPGDVSYYRVYRSTVSGASRTQINDDEATTDLTYDDADAALDVGTRYYYVVTAVDSGGDESDVSNEASNELVNPGEAIMSATFGGTSGQTLQAHDANWEPLTGSNTAYISDTGRVRIDSTDAVRIYRYTGATPASADYEIEFDWVGMSANGDCSAGVAARVDSSTTSYIFAVYSEFSDVFQIKRVRNGGSSVTLTSLSGSLDFGGAVTRGLLRVRGNTYRLYTRKPGEQTFTLVLGVYDSNPITGIGRVGLFFSGTGSDTNGVHIDTLVARPLAATTEPPTIDSIVPTTTATTLTVTWTTDELATSEVELGPSVNGPWTTYPVGGDATANLTSHSVQITGLEPGSSHYYRVRSENAAGYAATTAVAFVTMPVNVLTPGALTVNATFNTISLEQAYSGDQGQTASLGLDSDKRIWTVTKASNTGATSIALTTPLLVALPDNQRIVWFNDTSKIAVVTVLNGDHAAGATTLTVDSGASAVANGSWAYITGVQFKKAADTNWRFALPPARINVTQVESVDYGYKAFNGGLLELDAGTTYDIRLSFYAPDGVNGSGVTTTQVTTRAELDDPEDVWDALVLAGKVRYVSTSGNNSNDGSSGSPWLTWGKAITDTPSGYGVQFGPGHFTANDATRTTPIFIRAEYPRMNSSKTRINDANATIISSGVWTGPTGSGATHENVWTLDETLVGPNTATTYPVWTWTNPGPTGGPPWLGYGETRAEMPQRNPKWKFPEANAAWTDERRVEFIHGNQQYQYGAFRSRGDAATIYLRMPPNMPGTDPNDLYITWGGNYPVKLTVAGTPPADFSDSNVWVYGLEIRGYTQGIYTGVSNKITVSHCLIGGTKEGIEYEGSKGSAGISYGADHVVQYTEFYDANMRALPGETPNGEAPWDWIKGDSIDPYTPSKIGKAGGDNENHAIYHDGGAIRCVVRHCVVDGYFNGTSAFSEDYDKYIMSHLNVHGCTFRNIGDDCLMEAEPNTMFQYAWDNDFEYVSVVMTCAAGNYGPRYFWRNRVWKLGVDEVAANTLGKKAVTPLLVKTDPSHQRPPTIWILHNTLWTDQDESKVFQATNSGKYFYPNFQMHNNLIRSYWRIAHSAVGVNNMTEDYNILMTDDFTIAPWSGFNNPSGHRIGGSTNYRTAAQMANYRNATGQGAHTNVIDGVTYGFVEAVARLDPHFTDPANGDLSLIALSSLRETVPPLPNVSDLEGVHYAGDTPSPGYLE